MDLLNEAPNGVSKKMEVYREVRKQLRPDSFLSLEQIKERGLIPTYTAYCEITREQNKGSQSALRKFSIEYGKAIRQLLNTAKIKQDYIDISIKKDGDKIEKLLIK